MSLTRFEFVPFEIGIPLRNENLIEDVRNVAAQLGWNEVSESFDEADLKTVVPNCVGIFSCADTLCYIAESGFGVFRIGFDYVDSDASLAAAEALVDRIDFQSQISDGEVPNSLEPGTTLIHRLRESLRKRSKFKVSFSDSNSVFTYSLSAFSLVGVFDHSILSALLSPRIVGCSVSQVGKRKPTAYNVSKLIRRIEVEQPQEIICQEHRGKFYSSWSGVVVSSEVSTELQDLVTLCEFRVQSTWLTAFTMNRRAADTPPVRATSPKGIQILTNFHDFSQIESRVGTRLGANSPHDATVIVEDIIRTSELEDEIARANGALELARARIEFATSQYEARGKQALEVFGLIFAAAGLAQLMFTLPISAETFKHDLIPFILWTLITLAGVVLVLRQR